MAGLARRDVGGGDHRVAVIDDQRLLILGDDDLQRGRVIGRKRSAGGEGKDKADAKCETQNHEHIRTQETKDEPSLRDLRKLCCSAWNTR